MASKNTFGLFANVTTADDMADLMVGIELGDEATITIDDTTFEAFATEEDAPVPVVTDFTFDENDPRWRSWEVGMGLATIKPVQARVLHILALGICVVLCAATGFGKSGIFQGLYWVLRGGKNTKPS